MFFLKVCFSYADAFVLGFQADCDVVKIDIQTVVQGDVVLECIHIDANMEREEIMFRAMFNTAFVRSYSLVFSRDDIDACWDTKESFTKDFRAEVSCLKNWMRSF